MTDALVAQSVEHHHGKVGGVNGSNPFEGSFFYPPLPVGGSGIEVKTHRGARNG